MRPVQRAERGCDALDIAALWPSSAATAGTAMPDVCLVLPLVRGGSTQQGKAG